MSLLGQSIRIIRQAKGLTTSSVAGSAGISSAFLSLVEAGQRAPSMAVLSRLAEALDVPLETLVLLSAERGSSLRSSDEAANSLARTVRRLVGVEKRLRDRLRKPKSPTKATR